MSFKQLVFTHYAFLFYSVASSLIVYRGGGYGEVVNSLSLSAVIVTLFFVSVEMLLRLNKGVFKGGRAEKFVNRFLVVLSCMVLFVYLILCVLDLYVCLYFDGKLTPGVLFVLFETNIYESKEFFEAFLDHRLVFIGAFLLFPFLSLFVLRKIFNKNSHRMGVRGLYVIFVYVFLVFGFLKPAQVFSGKYNPGAVFVSSVEEYRNEVQAYHAIKNKLKVPDLSGDVYSASDSGKDTFVLVLGESTSRNHMGVYGYGRNTTPVFNGLKDELHLFGDVISPHSHTIPVLKKMLTFKNYESAPDWYELPTMMDVFNAAGYRTYWISNQEAFGVWGNVSSVFASQADVSLFNDKRTSAETSSKKDGDLVGYLEDILLNEDSEKKFIIIHLMGTHSEYSRRYPPEFDVFKPETLDAFGRDFLTDKSRATINHYDNSILYNDFVVSQIIKKIKKEGGSSYVLYLSDHGEEVYDERAFVGHDEAIASRFMVEIPFVLWLSEEYSKNNPEVSSSIKESLCNPYMTDDLIHTLMDLSSIKSGLFEPERSILNPSFKKDRPRLYAGKDYDKSLDENSKYFRWDNFEKIWAHRVNSIGKLKQARGLFLGVEMDLEFVRDGDGGFFDVNHPPTKSIGLTLDELLYNDEGNNLKYWLDLKNLNESNKYEVLKRLRYLLEKHNKDSSSIVLESSDYESLRCFSEDGIFTSYYFPYLKLDQMSSHQKDVAAEELINNSKLADARGISFPGYMYDFVSTRVFPELEKVEMLMWFPGKDITKSEDMTLLKKILANDNVKTVLVGFETEFDR